MRSVVRLRFFHLVVAHYPRLVLVLYSLLLYYKRFAGPRVHRPDRRDRNVMGVSRVYLYYIYYTI